MLNLVCLACGMQAQTTDFGAIIGAGYSGKIVKGFGYSVEGEVKTGGNFIEFNRFKVSGGLGYSFWKSRFKVSADFDYILKNRQTYMENRYRVSGGLTYSEKIRSFKLSLRSKYQASFYDESRAEHKFNPKTYVRNRFEISYSFFSKPVKLYASTEMFIRMYKKDARFIDEMRTVVGVTYRLNKNNSLDFYLRADNEVQVKNPANIYYIGVGYSFK
jgi:hypothetical protein